MLWLICQIESSFYYLQDGSWENYTKNMQLKLESRREISDDTPNQSGD